MRIANLAGRLVLLDGELATDVETASNGRFDTEPQAIYSRWAEFTEWRPQPTSHSARRMTR